MVDIQKRVTAALGALVTAQRKMATVKPQMLQALRGIEDAIAPFKGNPKTVDNLGAARDLISFRSGQITDLMHVGCRATDNAVFLCEDDLIASLPNMQTAKGDLAQLKRDCAELKEIELKAIKWNLLIQRIADRSARNGYAPPPPRSSIQKIVTLLKSATQVYDKANASIEALKNQVTELASTASKRKPEVVQRKASAIEGQIRMLENLSMNSVQPLRGVEISVRYRKNPIILPLKEAYDDRRRRFYDSVAWANDRLRGIAYAALQRVQRGE